MVKQRQGVWRVGAFALMCALLLNSVPAATMLQKGPAGSPNDNQILNAAVKIKTQKVADSIEGAIRGIDVSKYQGNINWEKVAQDNVNFAIARATYGTDSDPMFVRNAKEAHRNGLYVGAYHFARFTDRESMEREARAFISTIKQVDITYPVFLDLEHHRGLKKSTLTKLSINFMDLVKAEGYDVMLYSYQNFLRDYVDTKTVTKKHDLWVANYLEQPTMFDHKMWQHTSYGSVKGIKGRVDINIAYSDLSTKKKIRVSRDTSTNIKEMLNARYNAGLSLEGLDMVEITDAINRSLQMEINRQWGRNMEVDGYLDAEAFECLESVHFTNQTKGNITYLLQAILFYKGHFDEALTAQFDGGTQEALARFQHAEGLDPHGQMDRDTLYALLA